MGIMGALLHAVRPRRANFARITFLVLAGLALYLMFSPAPGPPSTTLGSARSHDASDGQMGKGHDRYGVRVEEADNEDIVVYRHDAGVGNAGPNAPVLQPQKLGTAHNVDGSKQDLRQPLPDSGEGGEPVHVVFAFGAEYIVPAFVAVNSTLHNSRTPSRLRLHLLVEQEIAERVQRAFTRAFGDIAQVTGASNAAGGSTGRRGQASGEEGSDEDVYGWAEDTSMLCRFASGRAPVIRTIVDLQGEEEMRRRSADASGLPQVFVDPFDVTTVPTVKVWQGPLNLVHPLNYARFQLADIYPTLDKIIYVDPDVVVQGDMCDMWDDYLTDDKYVIAAAPSKSEKYGKFIIDNTIAKVDLNEKYFNAGILVINLKLWREKNIDKQISYWLEANRKKPVYKFGSQPPLLLTFYRKYEPMSESWNFRHLGHKLTLKISDIENAKILHYNGPRKPWRTNGIEEYRSYWARYYQPDATTHSMLVWGFEELQDLYLESSHKTCYTRPTCREEADRLQIEPVLAHIDADPNRPKFLPMLSSFLGDMWKMKSVRFSYNNAYPWQFLWVRKQSDLPTRLAKLKFDWSKVDPSRQLVNFIPGVWEESYSKEALCRNTQRFVAKHGKDTPATSGFLDCFILPEQSAQLAAAATENPAKVWIGKEFQESSGHGIELYAGRDKLPPVTDEKPRLVQSYVERPFLVDVLGSRRKTDLRLYALVTSLDPVRVFLHPVGQVKVAQSAYSSDFTDQFAHISNKVGSAERAYDTKDDELRKERQIDEFKYRLTLEDLAGMLEPEVYRDAWEKTEDLVVRTVLAFANNLGCKSEDYSYPCGAAYQLFGIDVVYDENMTPYLMEVNNDPGWNPYYERRRILMATRGGTAVAPNTNCKFPFVHEGMKYFECAPPTAGKSQAWCQTDDEGRWGYCDAADESVHDKDDLQRVFNAVYGDSLFLAGVLSYNLEYERAVRERYDMMCKQNFLPPACDDSFVREMVVKMANEMENMGSYRMVFPRKGWRKTHLPLLRKYKGDSDTVGHVDESTLHIYDIFTEYFSYDFQDAALYRKKKT